MEETILRVSKIRDGTVIDHITSGHALDVVKIEVRELKAEEVDKIALIAPNATINIIRDYKVVEKKRVQLPKVIKNIVRCANPACISNSNEPVQPTFYVESQEPLYLKCHYCGYLMERDEILKQF